jgi:phenylalanyl-tRNA synthetase alpha chain
MKEDISKIEEEAISRISRTSNPAELESLRVEYLGRKQGKINAVLRSLKDMKEGEKKTIGPLIQAAKTKVEAVLGKREKEFALAEKKSAVDITLPAKRLTRGHLHLLTQTENEIKKIFSSLNFSIVEGPEVEDEYYNFDALNIPEDHPAREMWDTFWLKGATSDKRPSSAEGYGGRGKRKGVRKLLRTHTSPMQVRYMETHEPPFQIIVPGRCFRYEATDASHEINFYQFEGLMVGKDVSLANLKFIIEEFLKRFFAGKKVEFRYRPSYFPFVEPGLEVDIRLTGGGRRATCLRQGYGKARQETRSEGKWMELLGAGMVHPHVFEAAHYNPRDWQGFAFGMGIDRLAMVKYGVPDIRMFYSSDLRLIRQF